MAMRVSHPAPTRPSLTGSATSSRNSLSTFPRALRPSRSLRESKNGFSLFMRLATTGPWSTWKGRSERSRRGQGRTDGLSSRGSTCRIKTSKRTRSFDRGWRRLESTDRNSWQPAAGAVRPGRPSNFLPPRHVAAATPARLSTPVLPRQIAASSLTPILPNLHPAVHHLFRPERHSKS